MSHYFRKHRRRFWGYFSICALSFGVFTATFSYAGNCPSGFTGKIYTDIKYYGISRMTSPGTKIQYTLVMDSNSEGDCSATIIRAEYVDKYHQYLVDFTECPSGVDHEGIVEEAPTPFATMVKEVSIIYTSENCEDAQQYYDTLQTQ